MYDNTLNSIQEAVLTIHNSSRTNHEKILMLSGVIVVLRSYFDIVAENNTTDVELLRQIDYMATDIGERAKVYASI